MTQHNAKRPAVRARWEVSDTPRRRGFRPCAGLSLARAPAAAAAGILVRVGRPAHIAARAAAAPAAAAAAGRGPAHTAAASAAADRAAPLRAGAGARARRVRRRRPADRAGRLPTARIAAPLLDKVREYQAAEAVTETSHCAYLQKISGNIGSRAFYALRARLVSDSVGFRLDGRHRRVDDLLRLALRPLRLFHKGSPRR